MTPEQAEAKARAVIDATPTEKVREYAKKFGVRVGSLSIAKLREAVIQDFAQQILEANAEKPPDKGA